MWASGTQVASSSTAADGANKLPCLVNTITPSAIPQSGTMPVPLMVSGDYGSPLGLLKPA